MMGDRQKLALKALALMVKQYLEERPDGLVDLRDLTSGAPVRVVVNRMRGSVGWSEKDIAGMVEGFSRVAGLHFLPDDPVGADRALVGGRPLAELGDSSLVRSVAALADAVFPASASQAPGRRGRRPRRR